MWAMVRSRAPRITHWRAVSSARRLYAKGLPTRHHRDALRRRRLGWPARWPNGPRRWPGQSQGEREQRGEVASRQEEGLVADATDEAEQLVWRAAHDGGEVLSREPEAADGVAHVAHRGIAHEQEKVQVCSLNLRERSCMVHGDIPVCLVAGRRGTACGPGVKSERRRRGDLSQRLPILGAWCQRILALHVLSEQTRRRWK